MKDAYEGEFLADIAVAHKRCIDAPALISHQFISGKETAFFVKWLYRHNVRFRVSTSSRSHNHNPVFQDCNINIQRNVTCALHIPPQQTTSHEKRHQTWYAMRCAPVVPR